MSYSIIATVLLVVVTLSSSTQYPNSERNVLARFYSNFAQLYRPATLAPQSSKSDQEKFVERYEFMFTEKEYAGLSEESLTMLNTNVIERTVTYHPTPNFEMEGTRYVYRRDPKQNEAIEIALVNSQDLLFREVGKGDNALNYLYLSSLDGLEYSHSQRAPLMPYYEVTFICNSSFPKDIHTQAPLLSYIDKNIQWSPRYVVDLPSASSNKQPRMYAYADIRNDGVQTFVVKGAELIASDIKLMRQPDGYLRTGFSYGEVTTAAALSYSSVTTFPRPSSKNNTARYVYQLETPTSIVLPARSMKSIKFFETNVTVESFFYYSSIFSMVNSNGKLFKAYNITSLNAYIPRGRLMLSEQGRFVGEITLPDLDVNKTFTVTFRYDADVSYRKQVKLIEGDGDADSMTYDVEYQFENSKSSRDVHLYFKESFSSLSDFEIKDISTSNDNKTLPDLEFFGSDLRGYMVIPRQHGKKMIRYKVVMYKAKTTVDNSQQ